MKNFTKLLMAVVLLASYSCVQDVTEDLAPVISGSGNGSGEIATLRVALPTPSRTELGEKDADGKYPVYWSEEDVIAVNGKPTTGITLDEADKSVAVFDLPLGITIPYHLIYPYQGEDVEVKSESGRYPVVFAAEQQHTEGSFAPGAAPMFGWSNGFEDIQMHHLTAVLRLQVKAKQGESVDLRYVSVSTVGAEPISGVFDVYCGSSDVNDELTGTIEPRESAVSTVFYNFEGDSYTLSSDKVSVFYIAVPKGEYSRFEVNLVNQAGEVCVETFDADGEKKLEGGKLREFPVVEFEKNSKMFLIGNDADMLSFAQQVAAGTFTTNYDGALLVNDIDMTGKAWTSVEGYTSLFEGRNYTIKGLTTPLFGENTVATISNVKVEGAIVEEACGKVGLIARSLSVDGDLVGTIFNCSATGSIIYKNTKTTITADKDVVNVGGLVGGVYGGSVTLSESDVDVAIETAGPQATATDYTPCIGGVVGYACALGEKLPTVVENVSSGEVVWDDNSKSAKVAPFIGGVAGYVTAGSFSDNINTGELYIREAMYDLDWGGVIGASTVSVERCENKGSLTINEAVSHANIGGVIGQLEAGSVLNCVNSGKLLLDEQFLINTACNIGGVVAYADKGTKKISTCSNSGSITYVGSCKYVSRTSISGNANMTLGGVIGTTYSELVEECHNANTAVLDIRGQVSGNGNIGTEAASLDKITSIAGVIGVRGGKQAALASTDLVKTINCSNLGNVTFAWQYCGASYIFSSACIGTLDSDYVSSCKNAGSVVVEANVTSDNTTHPTTNTVTTFASGLLGYISSNCDSIFDCENAGSVTVRNSESRMMWISGLLGTAKTGVKMKFTRCGNSGDIFVDESVSARNLYVAGVMSNTLNIQMQYPECFNSGRVESKAVVVETYLGAILGRATGSDEGKGTANIQNTGRVIYSGTSAVAYVGGYCGRYEEKQHSVEFANAQTGVVEVNGTASLAIFAGGVAGLAGTLSYDSTSAPTYIKSMNTITGGEFQKGMVNNGNVTAMGFAPQVYVSGGFGAVAASGSGISGISNYGTVTVPENNDDTKIPTTIYMGGIAGYATMSAGYPSSAGSLSTKLVISNCNNTGDILYYGIARDGAYIGGLVGHASKAPLYNCVNDGDIISTGHAGDAPPKLTQAEDKHQHNGYAFNFKNRDLAIGGLVGETDLDIVNCENNGDVTHTCTLNPLKIDHNGDLSTSRFDIGGIAGRTFCPCAVSTQYAFSINGVTNNGSVTIWGTPSATNNTPSIDLGDAGEWQWTDIDDNDRTQKRLFYRVNVAGLIGRLMDNSSANVNHYLNNCVNNGNVSVPEAAGAKMLSMAGIVGDLLVSNAEFNGAINKGKISIEKAGVGTTVSGSQFIHTFFINMAGIVGTYYDTRIFEKKGNYQQVVKFNDCENQGDIYYGEVAASVFQCAGGILAQVLHTRGDWCIGAPNAPEGSYSGSGERYSCVDVHFNRCKNSGNINYFSSAMSLSSGYNYNYAGGILGTGNIGHNGYTQNFNQIDLTFDHCENSGSIQWDRNNSLMSTNQYPYYTAVGGIVGHHCGGIGMSTASTSYSSTGRAVSTTDAFRSHIISCKNSGRIWGYSGYLGGIIGCGNWYVKITGTADDPTINTGDIVVKREGGSVVTKNWYGNKYMYAGGIAGVMREYINAAYAVGTASGANNAYPAYKPQDQYCRIEYAVNEGAVGSTGYAGGIAGYYYSAVEASKAINNATSRGGLVNCRNTGDIYALEGATTNVGAMVGMPRMFVYTANTGNDTAQQLSDGIWPIGVFNCEIGGTILRGAVNSFKIDAANYMHCIYGESWADDFVSTQTGKEFDGCVLYTPAPAPAPEEGGEEEEM